MRPVLLLVLLLLPACNACPGRDAERAPRPAVRLAVADRCDLPGLPAPGAVDVRRGLVYVSREGQDLAIDLARPRGPGPFALVVLVHGGGWQIGERGQLEHETLMLAQRGYAAATVSYRLVGAGGRANRFPAAVEDLRCAIRFLRARARELRIDPRRVALVGLSAGGHLSALAAAAGEDARLDGACPQARRREGFLLTLSVSGVVALYAPLDLRAPAEGRFTPTVRSIVTTFLGVTPSDDPDRAALASPITHVGPAAPPFLLVHGTTDTMVPLSQSEAFKAALDRAGVPALLVPVEGAGHGFPPLSGFPALGRATCTTIAFLEEVLR